MNVRNHILCLTCVGLLCSRGFGQPEAEDSVEAIDPRASEIVQAWIANPPQEQHLQFVVVDSMDREEDGQRILRTHRRTATVSRPNRLRIESRGDLQNRDVIYDGTTITIHDLDHQVYGQLDFDGTIVEMIDALHEWYDVTMPLADLLGEGREAVLDDVLTGRYVGESTVGEHACHHVAFTGPAFDWQTWIDAGERPIMRRLAITYKSEPGTPQYVLTLENVESPDAIAESEFAFEPPEGAMRIRFLEAEELFGPTTEVAADATSPEVMP
jgi:hypothetical protein